jgi:hypothetical protein
VLDAVQIRDFAVTRTLLDSRLCIGCISVHELRLLATSLPQFHECACFITVLLNIFVLSPFDIAWSQVSCSECDMGCPVIDVSSF